MSVNINKKLNENLTSREFRNYIVTKAKKARTFKVAHSENLVSITSNSLAYHAGITYNMKIDAETKSLHIVAEKSDGLPNHVINLLTNRGYTLSGSKCEYRGQASTPEEFEEVFSTFDYLAELMLGRAEVIVVEDNKLIVRDTIAFKDIIEEIKDYAISTGTPVQDMLVSSSVQKNLSPIAVEVLGQFDAYLGGAIKLDTEAKSGFDNLLDYLEEIPRDEEEVEIEEPVEIVSHSLVEDLRELCELNSFKIVTDDEDILASTKIIDDLPMNGDQEIYVDMLKDTLDIRVEYTPNGRDLDNLSVDGFKKEGRTLVFEKKAKTKEDLVQAFELATALENTMYSVVQELEDNIEEVEVYAFKELCSRNEFNIISLTPSKIIAENSVEVQGHDMEFVIIVDNQTIELQIPDAHEEVKDALDMIDGLSKGGGDYYFIKASDINGMNKVFDKYKNVVEEIEYALSPLEEDDDYISPNQVEFELLDHACDFDHVDSTGDKILATKELENIKFAVTASVEDKTVEVKLILDGVPKENFDDILPPAFNVRSYGGILVEEFNNLTDIDYIVSKNITYAMIADKSVNKLSETPAKSNSDIFDQHRLAEVEAKIHLIKDPDQKEQLKRLVKYVRQVAPWINENNDYNTFFLEEPKEFKKYKIPTVAIAVTCYLMDKSEWPGGEWDPGQVYKKFIKAKRVVILRRWFKTTDPDGNKCWMAIFVDAQYAREHGRDLLEESLNKVVRHNGEDFIVESFKNGKAILMNESRSVMVNEFDVLFK